MIMFPEPCVGLTSACLGESRSVDADAVADGNQLLRRFPRMLAASSADVNPQFVAERSQSPLKSADDTCRDAGGMPVHAHHGAKGLKPEGIGEPPQQLI